ncbi:GNAT family N-acetyltransferase [Cytobacillus sp. IB215316]|uniref:GNAT family N-acetyltransferase n=1 Tax=Cytobacillus sp. IB215316 TaxID=3097354 RepID=UPI002A0FEE29|nr:GNAT family N-acetyltransferase [Cytobacillus sp. IB215316]MDX8361597.1 GNAT family N-acetyltransferase [Cytobacillus sp. IB215316]
MEPKLVIATKADAQAIFDIQVAAFTPLLQKYKDYETNPANEKIDRVITRITDPNRKFYKIIVNQTLIGGICIYSKEETRFWISPMFILPSYQGNGLAQKTLQLIEQMYPQAKSWELLTILEEKRNCYLYEKMGYTKIGLHKKINDNLTLVYYKRVVR